MNRYEFQLRTLSPLWTGDVDRDSSVVSESGMAGSLRYWFEGILRGRGIPVCRTDRCQKEACVACQLFGATGRARAFRLEVDGLQQTPVFFQASRDVATSSGNWLWNIFGGEETGGKRTRDVNGTIAYQFGVQALWSKEPFGIAIRTRMGVDTDELPVIPLLALTLKEALRKGGIGAKTQYGFGQCMHCQSQKLDELSKQGSEWLDGRRTADGQQRGLFSLHKDRFFLLHYETGPSPYEGLENIGTPPTDYDRSYIPCSYDIRYKYKLRNPTKGTGTDKGMRPAAKAEFGGRITDLLFGRVSSGEATASRIHVSHLIREARGKPYRFKVWGDVDPDESAVTKTEVVDVLLAHLKERFPKAVLCEQV